MSNISSYEKEEQILSETSGAFIKYLTNRGLLADETITDEKIRERKMAVNQRAYHNTKLLLENYRTIVWVMECFPDEVAMELDVPFNKLDALLDRVEMELSLGNRKLESRLQFITKSRILIDRMNEALSMLKKMPEGGERMYQVIRKTYIEKSCDTMYELYRDLHMSKRIYYKLRDQAITILSVRLWSAPEDDLATWLDVLAIIKSSENKEENEEMEENKK